MFRPNDNDRIRIIERLLERGAVSKALKVAGRQVELLLELGSRLEKRGNHRIAAKVFSRIIFLKPDLGEAWSDAGVVLANLGKHAKAVKCLDRAIAINPNLVNAWFNKGLSLVHLARPNEAVGCFKEVIRQRPTEVKAWFNMARVLEELGRYEEALRCYDEVTSRDATLEYAWGSRGILLSKLDKNEMAIDCFDRIIKINPKSVRAWYWKGVVLGKLGNHIESIECYNQVTGIDPSNLNAWTNKGLAFEDMGRYSEALDCFDEVIRINPDFALAWGEKGVAYAYLGKDEEALKCFMAITAMIPDEIKAWFNRGVSLCNLKKYEEALACFEEAVRINQTNVNAWLGKGYALAGLGKHHDEVKCYDEVMRLDPGNIEAWFNKGVALIELNKLDEALRCYDEILTIDRTHAKALNNKSSILGRLGRHLEALACCDEALKTAVDLPELRANRGIVLLNLRRYTEALHEFIEAGELFRRRGETDATEKMSRNGHIAENANELMLRMKPVDEMFVDALKSKTITELTARCAETLIELDGIVRSFETRELTRDAHDLLLAKRICLAVLSAGLGRQDADLDSLRKAKITFEKWGFTRLVIAVNSIENFVIALSTRGRLAQLPNDQEGKLLFLLRPLDDLDGILTSEISDRIKSENYYTAKLKVKALTKEPQIIYRELGDTEKDRARFCLVQLNFSARPRPPSEEFALVLENADMTRDKILGSLDIAEKNDVDIVCFPELSFDKSWLQGIMNRHKRMIIVGGSYYDGGYNVCPIMMDGKSLFEYRKTQPSPFENPETTGRGMRFGSELPVFQTRCGRFSVLTCIDYATQSHTICNYPFPDGRKIDFIINPCYDESITRFQSRCNVDCEDYDVSIIQVNKAPEEGKYGGTCIIGKEHEIILKKLSQEGFKPLDNIKYKLLEIDAEKMAIVDLDLRMKAPPVNLPIKYSGRIKLSKEGFYEYENGHWLVAENRR
jgi:tetratricopeptide (TPR) repeat protein